jgi:hypothetical protein
VKVTYGDGGVEAKGYLCLLFEPFSEGTLLGSRPWVPSGLPSVPRPSAIE